MVLRNVLYIESMDDNLIPPFILREAGLIVIKVLQSRLAKKIPVTTIQSHIPSQQSQRSPLVQIQLDSAQTHKQRIQTTKQHKPARIQIPLYKPVSIQIPQTVVQAPAPLIPL